MFIPYIVPDIQGYKVTSWFPKVFMLISCLLFMT